MTQTAKSKGLVGCMRCAQVWPEQAERCGRCGARLASRRDKSLIWVWVWWALGAVAYVPAMALPMLETRMLLSKTEDTILGGAMQLAQHGAWGVAAIVIVASVLIPVAKFAAIATLARSVHRQKPLRAGWQHRILHIVEFIGRWSMVDVFVVAVLSSLVQFSIIATVKPGPAALAFAVSVVCTMFSAQSLDARLIWDLDED